MENVQTYKIVDLQVSEIDQVAAAGDYTAGEVVATGAVAIRVGMTVAAVNPAAGAAIAAVGATAVLFGTLAASLKSN